MARTYPNTHYSPSPLQQRYPPFMAHSPSIHTRSIIQHPHLLHHSLQALLELKMSRVLSRIIIPVLLTGKLHHKGMRKTRLLPCQPSNSIPYHTYPRFYTSPRRSERLHRDEECARDRKENYLIVLRTILPPAGGRRDVRFLGRGMDAFVAEVDHALACLFLSLAPLSDFQGGPGCIHVRLGSLKAQARI